MEEEHSGINDSKEDSPEAEELRNKVKEFRANTAKNALQLVHINMPQKLLHLNNMLKTTKEFNLKLDQVPVLPLGDSDSSTTTTTTLSESASSAKKKRRHKEDDKEDAKRHDGLIPANKFIVDLLVPLKQEILELIETLNAIKMWIQLNIPRIEDGNNFGVSIQEETVNELSRSEEAGFAVLETMTKYYVTRAKLVSKILKYPDVEDYRRSVLELDEKEYINLRLCLLDLRNNYASLYDMITKNLEKLKTPRSSNHMNNMI